MQIGCFLEQEGYYCCVITHQSQEPKKDMAMMEGFVAYQAEVQEMYGIADTAVCNMDKTPIPYAPHHKYTIAKKGG